MSLQFEDIHPAFDVPGYQTTNEEPLVHHELLKGYRIRKAAAICSGGEIPIFVLLPRCQEVIAIDHSYRSLACTYAKATLLSKLGPDKMKELFTGSPYDASIKAITEHVRPEDAPEPLRKFLEPKEISKYPKPNPLHALHLTFNLAAFTDIRREMHYAPIGLMRRGANHIDRLRLIHGDIKDLAKYGPFDLFYASNAREHWGRDRLNPTMKEFRTFVKPNGLLLDTCYASAAKRVIAKDSGWKLLKSTTGYRTSWSHNLYQKMDEVAKPEVPSAK